MRMSITTDRLFDLYHVRCIPYRIWQIRSYDAGLIFDVEYQEVEVIINNDYDKPIFCQTYDQALRFARTCPVYDNVRVFSIYYNGQLRDVISARKNRRVSGNMTIEQEKDEDSIPVPALRSITGGRDSSGNWLQRLPTGTVFACRKKDTPNEEQCMQFHIRKKWDTSVWLHSNFPAHQTGDFIFHSFAFSRKYELVDIHELPEDDNGFQDDNG